MISKNNLMFIQKWYFWHSTCRMTSESSNSIIEVTKLWIKKRRKKKKKKWINTLTPWLSNHLFLNVWIMVCSELVAHDPLKCIFAKIKPSHLTRSKFIDHSCLRLKWGKAIFVIPFTFWNTFWAWIIFLSWKKSWLGSHPHTGGQEKISMRKEKKPWESQKGITAQETQMLGGMPKSLENVTSKIK